jgi:hypothetical protein
MNFKRLNFEPRDYFEYYGKNYNITSTLSVLNFDSTALRPDLVPLWH